jgi:hypothetical protein
MIYRSYCQYCGLHHLMPIQIRIRIGIKTMMILMRILPQHLHTLESTLLVILLYIFFTFLISVKRVIFSVRYLDSILKFSGKN